MENIQQAILSSMEAKPLEFKQHIETEINSRVYDLMQARKQEIAGNILNTSNDTDESEEDTTPEETDEEL